MADFNSSLPVVGSQHVTQSTSPWVVSGTATVAGTVAISTSPVPVSGIVNLGTSATLPVSGTAFTTVWIGTGSVVQSGTSQPVFRGIGSIRIAEQGTVLGISGIVNQGTTPWVTSGTATVAGTVNVAAGSTYLVSSPGSVAVYGTLDTSPGARSNIVNSYTSGLDVIAGGSMVHTYISTGSFYVSKVLTGFSGKGKSVVSFSGTSMIHKAVGFNSTANPNINLDFGEQNGLLVIGGTGLSVITFNRESTSAQDLYSTIIGYEVV